jgi:hypothetical protein
VVYVYLFAPGHLAPNRRLHKRQAGAIYDDRILLGMHTGRVVVVVAAVPDLAHNFCVHQKI